MNQKQIGISLFVFGVAVLATWLGITMSEPRPETDTAPSTQPEESTNAESSSSTDSWQTFTTPNPSSVALTLEHPPEVSVEQIQSNIYEFKFVGPDSAPNTEITDGYYGSIQIVTTASDAEAYAKANDIADTPVETEFMGRTAYRYQSESMLSGELVTHYVFAVAGTSDIVDISYQTYSDTDGSYEAEVRKILNSLTFEPTSNNTANLIKVDTPQPNTTVDNPMTLSGEARGYWFFEASAPVVVTNWDGLIIGEGYITADDEWMTEDFVPFSGTVEYDLPADTYSTNGTVIFQRSNPSDLPENDAAVEIPVSLQVTE